MVKTWHSSKQESIRNTKGHLGGCICCHHHCKAIQTSEQTQGPPHPGDGFCLLGVFSNTLRSVLRSSPCAAAASGNEMKPGSSSGFGQRGCKTGESPGKNQHKARAQSHHQAEDVVRGISLPSHPYKWRAHVEALEELLENHSQPQRSCQPRGFQEIKIPLSMVWLGSVKPLNRAGGRLYPELPGGTCPKSSSAPFHTCLDTLSLSLALGPLVEEKASPVDLFRWKVLA